VVVLVVDLELGCARDRLRLARPRPIATPAIANIKAMPGVAGPPPAEHSHPPVMSFPP